MRLRTAGPDDLDFILEQEARPEFADLILRDDRAAHDSGLADPDKRYVIAEDDDGGRLGYFIFAGLASAHRAVELGRMVIAEPDKGLGRQALARAVDLAFCEMKTRRLWLDVAESNGRARHLYRALGFVEEGVLREAVLLGDGYRSLVVMSILEREYCATRDFQ